MEKRTRTMSWKLRQCTGVGFPKLGSLFGAPVIRVILHRNISGSIPVPAYVFKRETSYFPEV